MGQAICREYVGGPPHISRFMAQLRPDPVDNEVMSEFHISNLLSRNEVTAVAKSLK